MWNYIASVTLITLRSRPKDRPTERTNTRLWDGRMHYRQTEREREREREREIELNCRALSIIPTCLSLRRFIVYECVRPQPRLSTTVHRWNSIILKKILKLVQLCIDKCSSVNDACVNRGLHKTFSVKLVTLTQYERHRCCSASNTRKTKIYTVSQKRRHYTLVHIFAKYWPIFIIFFHRHIQWEISNKITNKDPTSPQMCCYTTLWNVKTRKTSNNLNQVSSLTINFQRTSRTIS